MTENIDTTTENNYGKQLTDSLTGILKGDTDLDQARKEILREKYAVTD